MPDLPVPRRSPRFWEDDLRDYIEEFNKTHTTKINADIIAHNYMLAQQTHLARKPARRRRQTIQAVPVPLQALPAAPQPALLAPQQMPLALHQPPQPIDVLPVLPRVDDENVAGAFDNEAIGQLVGQEDGELQGDDDDDDDDSMDVKDSNEPDSGEDNTNVVHLAETSSSASHDISIDDESNIASSEVDEPRSRIFQDKTLDGTLVNSVSEGRHAVVGEKIAHQGISQLLLSSSIVEKAVGPTLDEQSVAQDDLPLQLLDLSSPNKSADAELVQFHSPGSVQSAMDASEVEEALRAGLLVDDAVEGDVSDQDHFDMPTEPSTNGEVVEDDQPVAVATDLAEITPGSVVHHQPDVDDVTRPHDIVEEYAPASMAPSPVPEVISTGSSQAEPLVVHLAAIEGHEDTDIIMESSGPSRLNVEGPDVALSGSIAGSFDENEPIPSSPIPERVDGEVRELPADPFEDVLDDLEEDDLSLMDGDTVEEFARGVVNGQTRIWTVDQLERFMPYVQRKFQQKDLDSLRAQSGKVRIESVEDEQHWVAVTLLAPIAPSDLTEAVCSTRRLTITDVVVLFAIFDSLIDMEAFCQEKVVRLSPKAEEVRSTIDDTSLGPPHIHAAMLEGSCELFGLLGIHNPNLHSEQSGRRLLRAIHRPTLATELARPQVVAAASEDYAVVVQPPAEPITSVRKRKGREEETEGQRAKKVRVAEAPDVTTRKSADPGLVTPIIATHTAVPAIPAEASGSGGKRPITSIEEDCVRDERLIKAVRDTVSALLQRWEGSQGPGGRHVDPKEASAAMRALRNMLDTVDISVAAARSQEANTLLNVVSKKLKSVSQISISEATSDQGLLADVKRRAQQVHRQYPTEQ